MSIKNIHPINRGELEDSKGHIKLRVDDMNEFPLVLGGVIHQYAYRKQVERGKFVDGYEDLAPLLNYSPQTIRKWTNISNPTYPPVSALIAMCALMDDWTPWEFFVTYAQQMKEARYNGK